VLCLVLIGCGDSDEFDKTGSSSTTSTQRARTTTAAPAPLKPRVQLVVHNRRKATQDATVVIKGVVKRGATVTVRGEKAAVKKGRFRKTLKLHMGRNTFTVVARHPERRTSRRKTSIERQAPPSPTPVTPQLPPVSQPPCPEHFTPSGGGCAPADNEAYDSIPANPDYDSIPEVPGIQGE